MSVNKRALNTPYPLKKKENYKNVRQREVRGIPQSEILSISLFKRENGVGNRFFPYT